MKINCFSIMNMQKIHNNSGILFIVSAPSGAGKTSVVNAVLEKVTTLYPLKRLITYTTKKPRPTDINGVDYHFVSESQFKSLIEQGFFLEWSCSYDFYYGTPRSLLIELNAGISHVAIVDQAGAQALSALIKNTVKIWIYTKDVAVLRERLVKRNTESSVIIAKRLMIAQTEIDCENKKGFYDYHVLNDIFEIAINELKAIIVRTLENGDCRPNSNNFDFEEKDF